MRDGSEASDCCEAVSLKNPANSRTFEEQGKKAYLESSIQEAQVSRGVEQTRKVQVCDEADLFRHQRENKERESLRGSTHCHFPKLPFPVEYLHISF